MVKVVAQIQATEKEASGVVCTYLAEGSAGRQSGRGGLSEVAIGQTRINHESLRTRLLGNSENPHLSEARV